MSTNKEQILKYLNDTIDKLKREIIERAIEKDLEEVKRLGYILSIMELVKERIDSK